MRTLALTLLAALIAAGLWTLSAREARQDEVVRDVSAAPTPSRPDDALTEVRIADVSIDRDDVPARTAVKLPKEADPSSGVPWPKGFARLDLRVVAGDQPGASTLISVESTDAVFDTGEENLVRGDPPAARTSSTGRLFVYVRPTRSVTIRAVDEKTGVSSTGTYTSPFEGKTRTIEIQLAAPDVTSQVELQFVSELDGLPVAGAALILTAEDSVGVLEVKTNDLGMVQIPGGIDWSYEIVAEGFVPRSSTLKRPPPGERLPPIQLRPLARIYGRITLDESTVKRQSGDSGALPASYSLGRIEVTQAEAFAKSWTITAGSRLGGGLRVDRQGRSVVDGSGAWSIDDLIVQGEGPSASIETLHVRFHRGAVRRRIATLRNVMPGDDIHVTDPWSAGRPWTVKFSLPDDPKGALPRIVHLTHSEFPDTPVRVEMRLGDSVRLPVAPEGLWSYRLSSLGQHPLATLNGSVTNDGSGSTTVKLAGAASVSGTFSIPGASTTANFGVMIVPPGEQLVDGQRHRPLHTVRAGSEFTLPAIPSDQAFELVLFTNNWAHGRDPRNGLFEHARVPVRAGDHGLEIVGKPYTETDD